MATIKIKETSVLVWILSNFIKELKSWSPMKRNRVELIILVHLQQLRVYIVVVGISLHGNINDGWRLISSSWYSLHLEIQSTWHNALIYLFSVNQGLEQSDTDSFQDSSLKLNVRGGQSRSSSLLSESSSQPEIHPFFKDSFGKFIVLYSYHAQDENDLSVERGQLVTLLNKVL